MTATEVIAKLAPVDLERLGKIFKFLGDHATELRLSSGRRLVDLTDVREYFQDLALAASFAGSPQSTARVFDSTCPRCGHVHQGVSECGELMGGGGICRCEMEVSA